MRLNLEKNHLKGPAIASLIGYYNHAYVVKAQKLLSFGFG